MLSARHSCEGPGVTVLVASAAKDTQEIALPSTTRKSSQIVRGKARARGKNYKHADTELWLLHGRAEGGTLQHRLRGIRAPCPRAHQPAGRFPELSRPLQVHSERDGDTVGQAWGTPGVISKLHTL